MVEVWKSRSSLILTGPWVADEDRLIRPGTNYGTTPSLRETRSFRCRLW